MVDRFSVDEGMRASGVISDSAADVCATASGDIGGIHQPVRFETVVQLVQYDAGLHARPLRRNVYLKERVHIFGHI